MCHQIAKHMMKRKHRGSTAKCAMEKEKEKILSTTVPSVLEILDFGTMFWTISLVKVNISHRD